MYATVADIRAEGVTEAQASDARLEPLLAEATALVDRLCGWWFEPRSAYFRMDGRGTPTVRPPVPPLRVDTLEVDGQDWLAAGARLVVEGAPILPGFVEPRLTLQGSRFPRGRDNVVAAGSWGYTEADGSELGRTPAAIRRATMLLVLRTFAPLTSAESNEARNGWRLTGERTSEQSYTLKPADAGSLSGDPEVDELLLPYVRPPAVGAA